jgi:hypothetical protein
MSWEGEGGGKGEVAQTVYTHVKTIKFLKN